MKKFKPIMVFTIIMTLLFTLGQSVYALKDVKNESNKHSNGKYESRGNLSYASGVSLIVKSLDLNIDHIRFVKEPLATDYFPNLKNKEWYSQAFIIAALHGLDIPKNVKATDIMTRQQFAHHLFKAIDAKGDFAFIKLYQQFNDEGDVKKEYMDSIQKLLVSDIVDLDKKNNFNPKKNIKRSDAAAWVYDAIEFVKNAEIVNPEPQPNPIYDPKMTITTHTKEVNKVTISAQVPHPGYSFRITSIRFKGQDAYIQLEAIYPDPDKIYPQVISNVEAITYISSSYKPVLDFDYNKDASVSINGN